MELSQIIKLSIPYFFDNHLVAMAFINKDILEYITKLSRVRYNDLLTHYPLLPIKLYAHRQRINPYCDTLFTNCSYHMDIDSLENYYLHFNLTPKHKTRFQLCCRQIPDTKQRQTDYDLLKTYKNDRGLVLRTYPVSCFKELVNRDNAYQNEFKLMLNTEYHISLVIKQSVIQQLCINKTNIKLKNKVPIINLTLISYHTNLKMMKNNTL